MAIYVSDELPKGIAEFLLLFPICDVSEQPQNKPSSGTVVNVSSSHLGILIYIKLLEEWRVCRVK